MANKLLFGLFVVVVVALVVGTLWSIGSRVADQPRIDKEIQADAARKVFADVRRFGPDEHGVVCYSRHYSSLACVQLRP
jgi:hypothetical protein